MTQQAKSTKLMQNEPRIAASKASDEQGLVAILYE
jgi:hypothetical protein